MKGFAKIIELPEYDVLLMRGHDDEGENVEMIAVVEGSKVTTTYGFGDDAEKADEAMKILGDKHAQGFVDDILKMMD